MAFKSFTLLCFSALIVSQCWASAPAASCASYRFSSSSARTAKFKSCSDLRVLDSFIHWTFYPSILTADIAFRKTGTSPESWVAWSLNPTAQSMVGSQCLVAFLSPQGVPLAFTTRITSRSPSMQSANLTFGVSDLRADYSNGEMIIFATLQLRRSLVKTNQVWQEGPVYGGTSFGMHPMSSANQRSAGTIDFSTGATAGPASNGFKSAHGVLNVVSWTVMMPAGVFLARYLNAFSSGVPHWFYAHRACQTWAYVIGVAGFVTGLVLGNRSPGTTHSKHRGLGIAIFCCATLQVLSLVLRPNTFHPYRRVWNAYHRVIGCGAIVMGVVNAYEGLHLLSPDPVWPKVFTGILIALAAAGAVLEFILWFKHYTNCFEPAETEASPVNSDA